MQLDIPVKDVTKVNKVIWVLRERWFMLLAFLINFHPLSSNCLVLRHITKCIEGIVLLQRSCCNECSWTYNSASNWTTCNQFTCSVCHVGEQTGEDISWVWVFASIKDGKFVSLILFMMTIFIWSMINLIKFAVYLLQVMEIGIFLIHKMNFWCGKGS